MCNCGNKRGGLAERPVAKLSGSTPVQQTGGSMWPDVNFTYTGQSALTVTGNITGRNYRFNAPGEQQLIDYRDAPHMMKVPVLKNIM
ncbi:MAG: hypothetical protein ABJB86_12125 [Bacteroidota bacterium]